MNKESYKLPNANIDYYPNFFDSHKADELYEILFKKIVKQSFGQRRKTLRNSLKIFNIPDIKKEDTIFAKRPEQLSVSDFIYLTNLVDNENI